MRKSLMMFAIASLAFASCSKDEVVEIQQDQIKFSASTENASRGQVAGSGFLNHGFKLWGYTVANGVYTPYMAVADKDVTGSYKGETVGPNSISEQGVADYFKTTTDYYFPSGATMDFYAILDDIGGTTKTGSISWKGSSIAATYSANAMGWYGGVETSEDAANHTDLIYAVTKGITSATNSIPLNFRHAKSQIVFNVGVEKDVNIEAVIEKITLEDVYPNGDFKFPAMDTRTPDYSDDEDGTEPTTDDAHSYKNSWGTWTIDESADLLGPFATHDRAEGSLVPLKVRGVQIGEDAATVTQENNSDMYHAFGQIGGFGIMFLIPQDAQSKNLVVSCALYTKGVNGERVKLFPATADTNDGIVYGDITKALTNVSWQSGKKYVYNLNFTEPSDLDKITFSVTVDEYQIGGNQTSLLNHNN